MAVNVARVFGELRPDLASKWNLVNADAAITAHEQGDFRASARMVDAMGRDDRISGCLETRIQAVLGLAFELQPADEGEEESQSSLAKSIADDLGKPFAHLANEDVQAEALKWRIMLGFWIGELIWYDENGKLCDDPQRLKIWHPQHIRWDHELQCFMANTADQGEVRVTHGDGKWIVGAGKGPRPWMRAAVRALFVLWLGRQFNWRDEFLYGERTGQGILAAKVPQGVETNERSQLVTRLSQVWRGIVAELHQTGENGPNADLELLETDGGPETFEKIKSQCDSSIAIRLLGQNLTTEVGAKGSFAATQSHERVRIDYLQADTDGLASDERSGALEPWVERKYGRRELAPWPHWDAEPPEDTKAEADGQKAFGDAMSSVQTAGFDVENIDDIAEKHGLKLKKRPEPKTPPAPATPPGQPPKPAKLSLLARLPSDPGFTQGQDYADDLVAEATRRATEALSHDVAAILRVVTAAVDEKSLRAGLTALYAGMQPNEFAVVLHRARIMAELAGKYSVTEDLMGAT